MLKNIKKKKPFIIIACILLVLLIGFVGFLIYTKITATPPKTKAENKLDELADKFYDHYYDQKLEELNEEDLKAFLSTYKESGLTINIENLQLYLDNFNIEDYSAFEKCNKSGTKVIIYPVEPYGKKDFRKSYTLNCKF